MSDNIKTNIKIFLAATLGAVITANIAYILWLNQEINGLQAKNLEKTQVIQTLKEPNAAPADTDEAKVSQK